MKISREYQVAGMMAVSAMFTLVGYEFIRSASTVLFKTAYGANKLPLVMAAMPVVVFAGVALYGWILSNLGPRRTLLVTSVGSAMVIFCCYLLVLTGSKLITPVLFLVKELYIVLLIEQYWSYINSSISTETARKVNGPITGIAGLGGAIGGSLVGLSAESLGTETMILLAAVSLLPAAVMSNLTYAMHGEPQLPAENPDKKHHYMGWQLFRSNKMLVSLLAIVVCAQVMAAVLDFKFQSLLSVEFAGSTDQETAFQGKFWGTLNSFVLLLQFILIPIIMAIFSLRFIHLLLPLVHFLVIAAAIMHPDLYTVGLAFFLFKAFDYSIFRAAKELLYIPLNFDERYRAKEVIDVLGYRSGKGGSSVAIVLLQKAGIVMNQYYLAIALVMAAVWLALIFPLTRQRGSNQQESNRVRTNN